MELKEFIVNCLRLKISTEEERNYTTNIEIQIPNRIDDIEIFIKDLANEIYGKFFGDKPRIGAEEAFFWELETYIIQLLFVSCIFNDFSIIQNNLGIVTNTYRDGNIEKHRYFCSNLLNVEYPSEVRVENCDDILKTMEKIYPNILKPFIDRIWYRVKHGIIIDRELEFESICPEGINPKYGIKEDELQVFLRFVASKTRKNICNISYHGEMKYFNESSLSGQCGNGQRISAEILRKYGLNPILSNNRCFPFGNNFASHNFVTVCINVEGRDRFFLIDTTYKQFCRVITGKDRRIRDSNYNSGYVSQSPGYMLSLLPDGDRLLEQLIYEGFFELTEKNAKLYFDAFFLSCNRRFDSRPMISELETGIPGEVYTQFLLSPRTFSTDEINNRNNGMER